MQNFNFWSIFDHFGAIFNSGAFKFNSGPVIHYQTKINAKYKAFKLDWHNDTKIYFHVEHFCVSKNFDFSIIEKYSTISTIANLQDFDFLDSLDFIVFYLK